MGESDQFSDQPAPPIQPKKFESAFDIPLEEGYFLANPGHLGFVNTFVDAEHRYIVEYVERVPGQPPEELREEWGGVFMQSVPDHAEFTDDTTRENFFRGVMAQLDTPKSRDFARTAPFLPDPKKQEYLEKAQKSHAIEVHNAQSAWILLSDSRMVPFSEYDFVESSTVADAEGNTHQQQTSYIELMKSLVDRFLAPPNELGVREPLPPELP